MTRRTRLYAETLDDRCLPSFSPATSLPVGPNPQAVATADFNNDGRLDLVTSNPGDHTISVLLGDGQGGFGAATHFDVYAPTGADRASLAIADFNEDGNLDVVAVNNYMDAWYNNWGDSSLLLGNGDGTFQTAMSLGGWTRLAAGDFNNDGHMDLVFGGDDYWAASYGMLRVYLGNGTGGFTYPSSFHLQLSYPPYALAVGDVNGDGKLDAVSADVFVMLGNGDGTLNENSYWYYTGPSDPDPRAVAVGDFTGDNIPDLVVAGQSVVVLPGRGDGMFAPAIRYTANGSMHTGVAVADFNGDGKLDAVTSDADTGTVSDLLGNGNGTLTYAGAYAVGSSPSAIAAGDFNGDGRPDLATADAGSNAVSVLLNEGTWTPPPPPPPELRIGDRTVTEGNTGAAPATFTVTLSAPSTQPVLVAYATDNGSATAGSDYQAASGTLTFAPGETTKTITVPVIGDRLGETNETFFVNLSNAGSASIADGQGTGSIVDDEPRISIGDVTKAEGRRNKTTLFTFTITLSAAYDQPVTMSFNTVNGTAKTSDNDYIARTGTLTFAPGETTKTITIEVKGDSRQEANEYFYLDLYGLSSNGLFTKNRGVGTILNDD